MRWCKKGCSGEVSQLNDRSYERSCTRELNALPRHRCLGLWPLAPGTSPSSNAEVAKWRAWPRETPANMSIAPDTSVFKGTRLSKSNRSIAPAIAKSKCRMIGRVVWRVVYRRGIAIRSVEPAAGTIFSRFAAVARIPDFPSQISYPFGYKSPSNSAKD